MAPSGHALEVLRTPARLLDWAGALLKTLARHRTLPLARDAAVEVAKRSQQMRDLATLLRDRTRCSVVVVTLPEPLPDYETRRLVHLLRDVDTPVAAVLINRVLVDSNTKCLRCLHSRQWQAFSMASLRRQLRGTEIYVTREFDAPIAGRKALQGFTQEIWRLA
jgi:arsenite-transporting ATPase